MISTRPAKWPFVIVSILAVFAHTSPVTANADHEFCGVVSQTSDGFVTLRVGPGSSYGARARLLPGDLVYYASEPIPDTEDAYVVQSNGCQKIDHIPRLDGSSGVGGWVNIKYLTPASCEDNQGNHRDAQPTVQVPEDFRGSWCSSTRDLSGEWSAYSSEPTACDDFAFSIDATGVKSADDSLSCTIRDIKSFDVCPWGMIFKTRQQGMKKRPQQINPWSPGYDLSFECRDNGRTRVVKVDWVIEKGGIRGGLPSNYLCPWNKR